MLPDVDIIPPIPRKKHHQFIAAHISCLSSRGKCDRCTSRRRRANTIPRLDEETATCLSLRQQRPVPLLVLSLSLSS
ncbi:hypothetical protein J6590_024332 [Homalodisca vitripennis]|nr:hypothetical protein J6590_024332 [Homalodisca vitripennis]